MLAMGTDMRLQATGLGLTDHEEGLVVVIANAVPYAEYLREARKLDILESSSQSSVIATNMVNCFHEVKFSDYEKL